MGKFKMINWQTLPFKKKSFERQMDRYIKCCIVKESEPDKVLDVICLFGFYWLMDVVQKYEQGIETEEYEKLCRPIDGEFVEVKSMNGALYHRFTRDEGTFGLCTPQKVGKAERDINGKVKVYHSIKVFTLYHEYRGVKEYIGGWSPQEMYRKYFGYRYLPLSDLAEPLQLNK
ncbi:MAG: hypothetical protein IJ550_02445 [Bacteroidaceae bacterium]|nr:hypothetical protein [Bacteroidaceae bacterium]